jgi:hypothetical protein
MAADAARMGLRRVEVAPAESPSPPAAAAAAATCLGGGRVLVGVSSLLYRRAASWKPAQGPCKEVMHGVQQTQ